MKTYKTWEVIKMLTENPELKFETMTCLNEKAIAFVEYNGRGQDEILWNKEDGKFLLTETVLNYKWTLVKEPVDFIEAAKAFNNGETVICIFPNAVQPELTCKRIFKQGCEKGVMREEDTLTFYMAVNGKWYIQEDEDNE